MTEQHSAKSRNPLRSLWFWVVLAFVILITAWSTLISVAVNNPVEKIEVEQGAAEATEPTE
ncbi:MAG: hypothetical protein AAGF10_04535 [Verrucomicrobiota bacterium]